MAKANLEGVLAQLGGAKTGAKAPRGPAPSRPGGGPGKAIAIGGRPYLSRTSRAFDQAASRKKRKKKSDDGGLLGAAKDFGASVVGGTLEAADIPRSFVASHLADIAGAAEKGDVGGVVGALGGTALGAVPQLGTGIAHTLGADVQGADKTFYASGKHGKDFEEHTGMGQYLQREIKRHPNSLLAKAANAHIADFHVPGTPVDVGISGKDIAGGAGDVATDPLTYLTGGASEIVRGGAKSVATHIVEQGAKDAAEVTLENTGKLAARTAAKKAVEGEAAKAAKKVLTKGTRSLSREERLKYGLGEGGLHFRTPGTGRLGRGVKRALGEGETAERTNVIIPKKVTDLANPVMDAVQGASKKVTQKIGADLLHSNKSKLLKILRDPATSPEEVASLLRAEAARTTENASREAGLRLAASPEDIAKSENQGAIARLLHPGRANVQAGIGPRVQEAWQGVRKTIKQSGMSDADVIHAVESGDLSSEAARATSDFFNRFHQAATEAGLDVSKRENYIPWQFTENGRRAQGIERGVGGTLTTAAFESPRKNEDFFRGLLAKQRGVKPEQLNTAEVRKFGEDLAQFGHGEALKGKSLYETNLDKIVSQQLQPLTDRVSQARLHNTLQQAGELKAADTAAKPGIDKEIAAGEKRVMDQQAEIAKLERKLRKGGAKVDAKQAAADAQAQAALGEPAMAGAPAPEGQLQFSDPVVEAPKTPAAKTQAYQRALDLGWNSLDRPHTVESIQTGLADATQKAQQEVAQGVENGLQSERVKVLQAAASAEDDAARAAADFQATALDTQDQLNRLYKSRDIENTLVQRLHGQRAAEQARQAFMAPMEKLASDPSLAGNRALVGYMNDMEKAVGSPAKFQRFLKYYDTALNNVKAWQLATPGFHVRNLMGGSFNNYIADVDFGRGAQYEKLRLKYYRGELSGQERDWMDQITQHVHNGQYGEVGGRAGGPISNTVGSNNLFLRLSRGTGSRVEEHLRGTLALDRLAKGRTLDEALADVVKYHFDYQDLSGFERNVLKRIVPFYAFTRYNTPLQIEMLLQSPGKYARYYQFQHAANSGVKPGTAVPSYYDSLFAIPTNNREGKNQSFLTPDLPNTQVLANAVPDLNAYDSKDPIGSTLFGVAQPYLQQVTPLIKAPIEAYKGEQFFKNIPLKDEPFKNSKGKLEPNPSWFHGPLAEAVAAAGGTVQTKEGERVTEKGQYIAEQFVPALARVRKIVPNSEKDSARQGASVDSTFGLPFRTLTKYDQMKERQSRSIQKKKPAKKWWEK